MGILVCQDCNSTVEHFEHEKVSVIYCKCSDCQKCKVEK